MKRGINTPLKKHASGLWKQAGVYSFFVVFSAILFFAHLNGFAHVASNESQSAVQTTNLPDGSFISNGHHAVPHPVGTGLVFVETEVVDATKSGSEFDSDIETLNLALPAASLHSGKSLFLQLKLANEGREKISLVVLHHCWKSFLS